MPAKKLTARKRAELKQKKLKQQRGSNFPVLLILFIIIIVAITGTYFVISNLGTTTNGQDTNGQVTNIAPSASEDYSVLSKNSGPYKIDALKNDYDPDNDVINITNYSNASHGKVDLISGNIYYTPETNFTGVDSFLYAITDGEWETTSTIHIFVADVNPIALIDTSKGTIAVELYNDKMPITCQNFINLANSGFYDGMIFHRILDDFMIQAGNTYPDSTTKESPYGIIEFEYSDVKHIDGSISMASTGAGIGGSAQFFICDGAQNGLDGSYAAFGKTIYGMSVVRDIADENHDNSSPAGGGKPITDIIINSITIEND